MTDIERKMADLAQRFATRAVEEREALTGSLASGDRAAIVERAHRLAGIAGMYGHPLITDAALALEASAERGLAMEASGQRLLDLLSGLESA
ncbi:MAG: Hpt domain-containing protein [Alphaproteobacteria bacterium]|nr:Hpt domain-containing protein [Alphaproteobacteria bacterium]